MEILSVSVAKGIYPASESDRDTNPGASLANYKVVHKGDVVYNSMRMWQGAVGSSDYDGIVSPAYVVARPAIELDSTCFGYILKRPEMLYKYLCDSQGNSKDTQTLKYNRFADIEVTMPANLDEQRVISACLGRVDALITLHQRMCSIFCFCAHGSRINFASILQGQLRILRYLRPMPKMRASPSALASGTTDIVVALSFSVLSPLARRPARQGRTPSLA